MVDYDKCYVMTAELRNAMIKELKQRKTKRVLKTLEQMDACYPTERL